MPGFCPLRYACSYVPQACSRRDCTSAPWLSGLYLGEAFGELSFGWTDNGRQMAHDHLPGWSVRATGCAVCGHTGES